MHLEARAPKARLPVYLGGNGEISADENSR
jgi:hypothetical protein